MKNLILSWAALVRRQSTLYWEKDASVSRLSDWRLDEQRERERQQADRFTGYTRFNLFHLNANSRTHCLHLRCQKYTINDLLVWKMGRWTPTNDKMENRWHDGEHKTVFNQSTNKINGKFSQNISSGSRLKRQNDQRCYSSSMFECECASSKRQIFAIHCWKVGYDDFKYTQ